MSKTPINKFSLNLVVQCIKDFCRLLLWSAYVLLKVAYIANNMDADQTAPMGAV